MTKRDNGLKVFMATPLGLHGRGGIDSLTDLIIDNFEAHPELDIRILRLTTRGGSRIFLAPFTFAKALWRFWIAARQGKVDLLHIHLGSEGSALRKIILASVARRYAVPYIVHPHADSIFFERFWSTMGRGLGQALRQLESVSTRTGSRYRTRIIIWSMAIGLGQAIDRLFLGSAAIVAIGEDSKRLIRDRIPIVENKIIVLPNATRPVIGSREPSVRGRVRISFLGEVGSRKGVPQLIDALGKFAHRDDWMATIAGNGNLDETCAHTRLLGIDDRVDFPGWLNSGAANDLLRRTDIFVLPSFAENMPMAILEAFAHGLAVIATPVGAIPNVIVHERNGMLVPAGDVTALAAALERMLDSPELRLKLGEAARRDYVERYEIHGYINRLAAIWRRAARS